MINEASSGREESKKDLDEEIGNALDDYIGVNNEETSRHFKEITDIVALD